MSLQLYNSYTRRKENFHPREDKRVRIYNCGPTVYDYVHIGNLRAFLLADILRRFLEYRGYKVRQVMNITDVGHMTGDADSGEDKMSVAARREGMGAQEVARFYEQKFFEDIDALEIRRAWKYPRATQHVPEMVRLVEKLLKRGHAYLVPEVSSPPTPLPKGEGGRRSGEGQYSVYYDLSTFPRYGKLSGNRVEDLIAGARVEVVYEKRNPYDFALWIYKPQHLLQWQSPWSKGYPGWHLECSAMSMKYLGETLDIHTGGEDNKFPHHECEIAQSEGATGKLFARYWLHAKHLLVNGKKMSKSLGNFYTLRNLLEKGYHAREIRYALISTHYRETLNFTLANLNAAKSALSRVDELVEKLHFPSPQPSPKGRGGLREVPSPRGRGEGEGNSGVTKLIAHARRDFIVAMDDDLNVSKALAAFFNFVRKFNRHLSKSSITANARKSTLAFLHEVDAVLGLGVEFKKRKAVVIPAAIKALVAKREEARKKKDWARADKIRAEVEKLGYSIEDTDGGQRIKKR